MQELEAEEANMWTRKDINDFKESIKKDESDAILKVTLLCIHNISMLTCFRLTLPGGGNLDL